MCQAGNLVGDVLLYTGVTGVSVDYCKHFEMQERYILECKNIPVNAYVNINLK